MHPRRRGELQVYRDDVDVLNVFFRSHANSVHLIDGRFRADVANSHLESPRQVAESTWNHCVAAIAEVAASIARSPQLNVESSIELALPSSMATQVKLRKKIFVWQSLPPEFAVAVGRRDQCKARMCVE